ncbi:cysteinyl-tRNA synthetase [Glaciecola punicea ACAM 611]|jgi:cysteinyl-tRNA synthetase|uniref:Cysteine--tRNA ligase n=1 Tax=Glaciecola punicea ACAM 611 TaxID=1121923 RepID=H5TAE4_9ALTE|nr:cysteine--tRNA ligase [Glaciecola punicea]OFA29741.1 cysteine--tRNA ligase [Glaciecola punicea]GAB55271.1 cysteinyl-tRNA synthetase [Glaciecola punicea ACAM 611]
MLQIYNTLSKEKQPFTPIVKNKVGLYVCGITVYDLCHMGHARTYLSFDIVLRYLRHLGFEVKYVRNITDVDDKIIQRAQQNNETPGELTQRTITEMHADFAALNLLKPDVEPRVTTHMPEIITVIERLIDKGYAYQSSTGDVLFKVNAYEGYGKLSKQDLSQLVSGIRVQTTSDKHDPLDFILWKGVKEGEISWASPWGEGRPGWHIECSAMNHKHLGEHFDIHGGGSDLIFPHHENEVAQSCCAYDTPYVNTWMHTGMVQINNEKMSKSLDNFFTLRSVLEKHDAETLRFFLMSAHYRSQLSYSQENIDQARASLERFYTSLRDVKANVDVEMSYGGYLAKFEAAMNDDFNMPVAVAVLFDIVKDLNKLDSNSDEAKDTAGALRHLGKILGILENEPEQFLQGDLSQDLTAQIEALIAKRIQARTDKNWASADAIRDELSALGVILEESKTGTTWRKA